MKQHILKRAGLAVSMLLPVALMTQCIEDDTLVTKTQSSPVENKVTSIASVPDCSTCTYIVPEKTHVIDGKELGLKPGSIIGLDASKTYHNLLFKNIVGTYEDPIIIKNCNGTAILNGTGLSFTIKTENSAFFQISGGSTSGKYGIRITGGNLGITLDKLSTNFEVDHVEIHDVGFAGIMAKTDPSCDDATVRGNFVMRNVYLHDNFIHDTGGEGIYLGNSFYENGRKLSCGVRYPHEVQYIKVNNNIVRNTGWDGIQVGCATRGSRIYGNIIENYGTQNVANQKSGIQIGEGTGGICYGNLIRKGSGNGMTVLGLGDNMIYNNVIEEAGGAGVFCDERYTPGDGFKFINNTILNPKFDGIRIYAEKVPMNVIVNNIITNPGSYYTYSYPRKPEDAFIYKLSKNMNIDMSHNYFSTTGEDLLIVDAAGGNYRMDFGSPAIDNGRDVSVYGIKTDYYKKARLRGAFPDIGAVEHQ